MISYSIQGAVLLIFGPLLLMIVVLVDAHSEPFLYFRSRRRRSRRVELVLKLALPTHRVNSFTAASVLISTAIRRSSRAPVFEARFSSILSLYQLIICFAGSVSYLFFCPVDELTQWLLQIILYGVALASFGIQSGQTQDSKKIALTGEGGWTWRYFPSEQIAKDCDAVRGYPTARSFEDAFPHNPSSAAGITVLVLLAVSLTLFVLLWGRIPTFGRGSIRAWVQPHRQAFSAWCTSIWMAVWGEGAVGRFGPGPVVALCASAIFTAGLSFAVIVTLISLQKSREEMSRYTKDEYEDNEWGFGQVLAVAVWVTYFLDALFLIIGKPTLPQALLEPLFTMIEAFLPKNLFRKRRVQVSRSTGASGQPSNQQQQPSQVQSSVIPSQEQATGADLQVIIATPRCQICTNGPDISSHSSHRTRHS